MGVVHIDAHDMGRVVEYQKEILELYREDITKYSDKTEKIKIRNIFDSISSELNSQNKRFILTNINTNARQINYESSFLWLSDAGVALPCYNTESPTPPLSLNEKHNLLKLFLCDTGLLTSLTEENIQFDILQGNMEINGGGILENVIAEELKHNGFDLYYFSSKKLGKLDFVIQNGLKTNVIDVKSGNDYKHHPSLDRASKVEDWSIDKFYVLSKGNIEKEENVIYLPWYMTMFIKKEDTTKSWEYKIDLSSLEF